MPLLNTDVINSVNIVSTDLKDTDVNSKTIELKLSARLSRKRTLQNNSIIVETIDRLDDSNEREKITKVLRSNKIKSVIHMSPKNDNNKSDNRDTAMSTTNTSSKLRNVSNMQSSLNTIVGNKEKMSVKNSSKALKNKNSSNSPMGIYVENVSTVYTVNKEDGVLSNDFVKFTRKRGRPPQKELKLLLRDDNKVNTSCNDEVDRHETDKGLPEPVEKSHNVYNSELTALNENDRTPKSDKNNCDDEPPESKRKRTGNTSSAVNVEIFTDDSCRSANSTESVKTVSTTTSDNNKVLPDVNELRLPQDETFDRDISLVSNRFNVPCDTLRNIIEKESVSVFREKYSDSVTPSMVTISPVVSIANKEKLNPGWNSNGVSVKYKIESIRESMAYEKTNLKDTMEEISKIMPSWSLSIVADPPRYVISHMSIETYGTPIANKSIVLDRYFRASVYINQCLEYKYCKRYTTASEIINLIKELDAI